MKYFIVLAVPLIEEDKKVPGISNEILVACLDNIRNRKPGHLLIYEGINTYEVLKQFQNNFKEFCLDDLDIDGYFEYYNPKEVKTNNAYIELEAFIQTKVMIKKKKFELLRC